MEYIENNLTYEDYVALRASVDWNIFDEGQTRTCVSNSTYTVTAVDDGEVIGMARMIGDGMYFLIADVVVRPEYQGKGIGSRLVRALENVLFYQGYQRIYALITAENANSIAFHQKMGYKLRAELPDAGLKFGRWIGVVWMDKASDFVDLPISFPRSWKMLIQDGQSFSDILGILSLS